MTALAVSEDMPLNVYLVGSERAIPENYLHVRLNPFNADWDGSDELDLVSAATNRSGKLDKPVTRLMGEMACSTTFRGAGLPCAKK